VGGFETRKRGSPIWAAPLGCASSSRSFELCRVDGNAATALEADGTVHESEERVVVTHADVRTGVELSAALANDDVAGDDGFATEALDAAKLGVGVTTVAGRTLSFLMCHGIVPRLGVDASDAYGDVSLTVTTLDADVLATLEAEDHELWALGLSDDFGRHRSALHLGGADGDVTLVGDEQHVVKSDRRAGLERGLGVTLDHVALADGDLAATV